MPGKRGEGIPKVRGLAHAASRKGKNKKGELRLEGPCELMEREKTWGGGRRRTREGIETKGSMVPRGTGEKRGNSRTDSREGTRGGGAPKSAFWDAFMRSSFTGGTVGGERKEEAFCIKKKWRYPRS